MARFEVDRDSMTGVITCRVDGFLGDQEADMLAAKILAAIRVTRSSGSPLRLMINNRNGTTFSARAQKAMEALRATYDPRDRTAVVVADSIHKLQAKRQAGTGTEVFVSEHAAETWLKAWDHAA